MRKIIYLISILLVSCTSDDGLLSNEGCVCEKIIYKHEIIAMNNNVPIWGYNYQYKIDSPELDCNDRSDQYTFMGDNLYYKVICE